MKYCDRSNLPAEAVSHNPAIQKWVMLRRGDVPHVTQFAQSCFGPGEMAAAHAHGDMAEVFFVEAGRGVIEIDGQIWALEPGVCVAVEPGEVHEVRNTGDGDLRLTYFGVEVAGG